MGYRGSNSWRILQGYWRFGPAWFSLHLMRLW
jgi:hypothetical protein